MPRPPQALLGVPRSDANPLTPQTERVKSTPSSKPGGGTKGPGGTPSGQLHCPTPQHPLPGPLQVSGVGSWRRAATLLPVCISTATSPLGCRGVFLVSYVSRIQRGKHQEKVKGISRPPRPSSALGFPCRGTSEPALRLPTCLSVWFRKTSPEKKPGRRQVQRQGGGKHFFARCVCVSVCVSILPGGCSHLCSFQKSPDLIPRAYKASFSIRKETAVKAADGVALQGPELGLITLLLPGMILVVSYSQAHGRGGGQKQRHNRGQKTK